MSNIKKFISRKKDSFIAEIVSQEDMEKFDPIYAQTKWNALIYKQGEDGKVVGVAKLEKRSPFFTFDLFTEDNDETDRP